MIEIFQNFEQITARFSPLVLILSGIVLLMLGLCIWIAGHSLRKIIISLVGLTGGIIVGLYVVRRNIFSAALLGALAALISLILEKVLAVLLASALSAVIAFAVLSQPYFVQTEIVQNQNEISTQTAPTGLSENLRQLKTFGLDAGEKIKQAGTNIPVYIWAIIAAVAAVVLISGILFWRWTSATFFSVSGTMVIFLGMILLLSYKGAGPITHIRGNPFIAAAIFLAMAGFGTIVQLLLCKSSKKEKIAKIESGGKKGKENKDSTENEEHDWRNA